MLSPVHAGCVTTATFSVDLVITLRLVIWIRSVNVLHAVSSDTHALISKLSKSVSRGDDDDVYMLRQISTTALAGTPPITPSVRALSCYLVDIAVLSTLIGNKSVLRPL